MAISFLVGHPRPLLKYRIGEAKEMNGEVTLNGVTGTGSVWVT